MSVLLKSFAVHFFAHEIIISFYIISVLQLGGWAGAD
jgi:hypothetical protein